MRRTWLFLTASLALGCGNGNEAPRTAAGRDGGGAAPGSGGASGSGGERGDSGMADGAAGANPSSGGSGNGGSEGGGGSGGSDCPEGADYFGAPRCGCKAFLLCDDFERSALGTDPWTLDDSSDATATIETTRAARGTHALHVHTTSAPGSHALLIEKKTFPVPSDTFFGRTFLYWTGPHPQAHTSLFMAEGKLGSDGVSERLGFAAGDFFLNYSMSTGHEDGAFNKDTSVPSADTWHCLEWQYAGDTNELHFWLDDVELQNLAIGPSTMPPWAAPIYDTFEFGFIMHHDDAATAPAFDLWYDELALSAQRVGCKR